MHAPLWISTQCFDCQVERLEIEGSSAIVKTRERRYFRLDTDSTRLLQTLMQRQALYPEADAEQARLARLLQERLLPLGIYRARGGTAPSAVSPHRSSGTLRWHRQLLGAEQVQTLAALLARLLGGRRWLMLLALSLLVHAQALWQDAARLGLAALLSPGKGELAALLLLALVRGLLHELGHAAACWRLSGSVGAIGCGIFLATPVLYCDVSDVHLLSRRAKAAVGLAGTVMDLIVLALLPLAAPIAAALGQPLAPDLAGSLSKLHQLSLLAVLANLLPFYRNDGFWVLNDLCGSQDLLRQSLAALGRRRLRLAEALLLAFCAICAGLGVALSLAFAGHYGPQQLARAMLLGANIDGLVLAGLTLLQYAALVFACHGLLRLLWRGFRGRRDSGTLAGMLTRVGKT